MSEHMETDLASVPQNLLVNSNCVLKPRNLLVRSNCNKNCDYGRARASYAGDGFHNCPMTEYVFTRRYRAPEVPCLSTDYGKPTDLWSVGCIFAEMLKRRPLFPGKITQHLRSSVASPRRRRRSLRC